MKKVGWIIYLILIGAFLVRLFPLNFPVLSADETRIAFRGYTLSTNGSDELGRKFPLIFNSLEDYQLPVTSYLTAFGILIFGKNDLGARIPFILLGTGIILLIYKIAQTFSFKKEYWIISSLVLSLSPALIFSSKIPNESIVTTFLFTLLFYLLRRKNNLLVIFIASLVLLFTSKFAWLVFAPFITLSLFSSNNDFHIKKITLSIICILISFFAMLFFLQIPQSKRSLSENNFAIFKDIGIKNGIENLRVQGIQADSPPILEKILFNKSLYFVVGLFHWLSHLQPGVYFAQFDKTGLYGFIGMGAWPKIAIIPFILGLSFLIKKGFTKEKILPFYILILTFPLLFVYPNYRQDILIMTLPLMSLIIASGLTSMHQSLKIIVLSLMFLEILINSLFLTPNMKNANSFRPEWVKSIVADAYLMSGKNVILLSDNIASDISPFFGWYTTIGGSNFPSIDFPYKFRPSEFSNIKLIGSEVNFYKDNFDECGPDSPVKIFVSNRDLKKIQRVGEVKAEKMYKDSLGNDIAFFVKTILCMK